MEDSWVDLLHVAKTIRRSVRPVAPSPRFARHLRTDLAHALGSERRRPLVAVAASSRSIPRLVVGACLGLAAVALALLLLLRPEAQTGGGDQRQ